MTYTAEQIDGFLSSGSLERLGMGIRRVCYRLPCGRLCVKCYRSDAEIEEGKYPGQQVPTPLSRTVVNEIRTCRFDRRRNTSCREYDYWLELAARLPPGFAAVFPRSMQIVKVPSRGWCLVEEAVENIDGTSPLPFIEAWVAAADPERTRLLSEFNLLEYMLARRAVRFFDPQNVLVQKTAGGGFVLRITDFEPMSRTVLRPEMLFPALVRAKVRRRFSRLRRYMIGFRKLQKSTLAPSLRVRWDRLIAEAAPDLGLEGCLPFLENKLVNDIFYKGRIKGVPCIVKCSSKAPDSISNEYNMLKRLAEADPEVFPRPLALREGRMAFVAMEDVGHGDAKDPAGDIMRMFRALKATGIVHRDINVDNIVPGADGHLKLVDFQFAVDRNAYRETSFMRRNPKYLYLVFGNCEALGLGRWNDLLGYGLVECMRRIAPDGAEAARRMEAEAAGMTFAAPVPLLARIRLRLEEKALLLRSAVSGKESIAWRLYKLRKLLNR